MVTLLWVERVIKIGLEVSASIHKVTSLLLHLEMDVLKSGTSWTLPALTLSPNTDNQSGKSTSTNQETSCFLAPWITTSSCGTLTWLRVDSPSEVTSTQSTRYNSNHTPKPSCPVLVTKLSLFGISELTCAFRLSTVIITPSTQSSLISRVIK
jgi:hypothetical protein